MSNVFYDSMLLDFENDNFNKISSYGYAFGYLGGGIAFVIALIFLYYAGHSNVELIASKKIVFIFTSIWWLLFMLPLILFWKLVLTLFHLQVSLKPYWSLDHHHLVCLQQKMRYNKLIQ